MSVAVFDCFSGIAGDMTLAALADAGADLDAVRAGLAQLGLPPFEIVTTRVTRGGLRALHVDVRVSVERTYQPPEMRAMVAAAAWPDRVAGRVLEAIEALAKGEAAAHGADAPHLHEAGGVDAMVDLCGAMLALESLDVSEAWCPVVTVGAGTITRGGSHGPLPAAPGPAAAYVLQAAGFALRFVEASHELVTPTGAAILAAVARPGAATIVPATHGAGAGTFDPPGRPNALRIFVGAAAQGGSEGLALREVSQLEANVDDMPPSLLALARDRLLEEGAFDSWLEPAGMKKGRSATKLCVLVPAAEEARFAALIVRETSTLGVRSFPGRRYEAPRRVETFASSLGPLRVKVRDWPAARRAAPEFEDVKALAARLGRPALDVQRQLEAELSAYFG